MTSRRPLRKIEKWSEIFQKLNLDFSKPLNYITAREIKQSCQEEPRLMAKMDTIEADIPQANDVNKIIQFPYRVFDGYDTSHKMMDAFCFVKRQSSYYRQAAEILGLVTTEQNRFKLTRLGEELLNLPAEQKSVFVCKLLLSFTVMNEIFLQISVDHNKVVTRHDVVDMLKDRSRLMGDTLGRRAQTILAWFRWVRNNLGMVEIEKNGSIRLARQMRLI